MFRYDGSQTEADRLAEKRDHCKSEGADVISLAARTKAGLVLDGDGRPLTAQRHRPGGILIYAISTRSEMHVAPDGERGSPNATKHETLFHNAPVLAAGELTLTAGVIDSINDKSGTYGTSGYLATTKSFREAVLRAIRGAGATLAPELEKELSK